MATIGTSTTNLSADFITTTGTINAGGLITAYSGITGPTGSFTSLLVDSRYAANTTIPVSVVGNNNITSAAFLNPASDKRTSVAVGVNPTNMMAMGYDNQSLNNYTASYGFIGLYDSNTQRTTPSGTIAMDASGVAIGYGAQKPTNSSQFSLDISGNTNTSGTATFLNQTTTNNASFNVLGVTGQATINTLAVTQTSQLTGNVGVNVDPNSSSYNLNVGGNSNVTGTFTANAMTLTSGSPSYTSNSVVPKSYVDAVTSGLVLKQACDCATTDASQNLYPWTSSYNGTSAFTSVGTSLKIDGYDVSNNDRVLVRINTSITDISYNGIYVYNNAGLGSLTRSADLAYGSNAISVACFVKYGQTNAKTSFLQVTNPATTGISDLVFYAQSTIDFSLGSTMELTNGNTLNVNPNLDLTTLDVSSNVSIGGITTMYNATGSSAYNQGALQVTGGVGIGQNLYVRGTSNVTGATILSSTLAVSGNTILANVAVSGTLDASGVTTISNPTNTALTTSGALVVPNGSVGIGQRLNVGGITTIFDTTPSGNTTSGALQVKGGVGIAGNLWSGGSISAGAGTTNLVRIAGGPGTGERCLYIQYNGSGTSSDYGIIQAEHQGTAYRNLSLNPLGGNVGIGTTNPNCTFQTIGIANISGTSAFAVSSNYMTTGSLTLGNTTTNYGGGNNWSSNTAGLMFECADNTEIMVHDSGKGLASFMYYTGASNLFTIGRDAGWGVTNTHIAGNLSMVNASTITCANSAGTQETFLQPRWSDNITYLNYGSAGFNITNNAGTTSAMFMTNAGNVGIGTSSPAYRLDVNGSMRIPNGQTILSNNSSGNAENFLWPRWTDNITYLNYGSGGFNIRNNSDVRTMFMGNSGDITMNKVFYPGILCGWYNNNTSTNKPPWYYVFSSQSSMELLGGDDYWYILPGYRFVTYSSENYATQVSDWDNRSGTNVTRYGSSSTFNKARSVKVYFGTTEITIPGFS